MNATDPYQAVKRTPADPLADQIRRAFRASGRSLGNVAKDAGIDRRALARFVGGQRDELQVSTADAILDALGLRVSLSNVPNRKKPAR